MALEALLDWLGFSQLFMNEEAKYELTLWPEFVLLWLECQSEGVSATTTHSLGRGRFTPTCTCRLCTRTSLASFLRGEPHQWALRAVGVQSVLERRGQSGDEIWCAGDRARPGAASRRGSRSGSRGCRPRNWTTESIVLCNEERRWGPVLAHENVLDPTRERGFARRSAAAISRDAGLSGGDGNVEAMLTLDDEPEWLPEGAGNRRMPISLTSLNLRRLRQSRAPVAIVVAWDWQRQRLAMVAGSGLRARAQFQTVRVPGLASVPDKNWCREKAQDLASHPKRGATFTVSYRAGQEED